ncbi:THO complex subunit 7 homolog [Neocloeon triangulifer]|uniref:THO complex subunit 7 homolog n=1 Tax=Neocloeon triangulifer TaxID=2078957 RepID=UPI00286F7B7C|nr:THO complex subunit 7 homolog [Neocloeon triangulifer]
MMTEEEVIKRRLLIDGDGTGDDRRINLMLRSFIKYCNNPASPEEDNSAMNRMLLQLSQSELASEKFLLGSHTSNAELKSYEELKESIKNRLETAKTEIEEAKESFKAAKEVRKNRVQYNVLAKVIKEQPDRKGTLKKLEESKAELAELESKRKQIDDKLEMRRKRLHLLNVAIHDFIEDANEIKLQLDSGEASSSADNAADSIDLLIEPFDLEDVEDQAMSIDP